MSRSRRRASASWMMRASPKALEHKHDVGLQWLDTHRLQLFLNCREWQFAVRERLKLCVLESGNEPTARAVLVNFASIPTELEAPALVRGFSFCSLLLSPESPNGWVTQRCALGRVWLACAW